MGKHAAPRPTRQIHRVGTVSAATVVLCLGAGGTALASTGPSPVPSLDAPVAGLTPPPVPKPVADAVQKVSDVAGIADPLASGTSAQPRHKHRHARQTNPTTHVALKSSTPTQSTTHRSMPAT